MSDRRQGKLQNLLARFCKEECADVESEALKKIQKKNEEMRKHDCYNRNDS